MFRVLEKATEGHGYEVHTCWLSGPKAGMRKQEANIGIGETSLRGKANSVCETKISGQWIVSDEVLMKSLTDDFNEIRKAKKWPKITFKRIDEILNPSNEGE